MIKHHPPLELLVDYATGSLAEPAALVVATHGTLCSDCRETIGRLEAIGGALLETIPPEPLRETAIDAMLARLDDPEPMPEPVREFATDDVGKRRQDNAARPCGGTNVRPQGAGAKEGSGGVMPAPLRGYLSPARSSLPWRQVGSRYEEIRLPIQGGGFKASLMRLSPGCTMPVHTHRGCEYTLVLAGGYRDNGERFARGDFALKDASDTHRPVVDPDEECVCLVCLDAPVKLTGVMGRLFNPFLRL